MAAAPELAPEAEVTIKAIPQVGALAVLIVVLGIILAIDAIVRGLFGTLKGAVGWIPFAGKVLTTPIKAIEHKVVSFLSGLEVHIDSMMGHHAHQLARLAELFWHTLERLAVYCMLVGAIAAGATANYVIGPIERFIHRLVRKIEAELHYLRRTATRTVTVIRQTITHNVYPRIKAAAVSVPRYIHRDLLAIREEALHAEKVAGRALRRVHRLEGKFASKPFAAAVAVALTALGLDWLRCRSNPFNKNKHACSLWNDFSKLLGIVAAAGLALNIEAIVKLVVTLEKEAAPVLATVDTLDDGLIRDAAKAVGDAANAIAGL